LVAATFLPCMPRRHAPDATPGLDDARTATVLPDRESMALNSTSAGSIGTRQSATSASLLPLGYELEEGTLVLGRPLPLHFGGELAQVEIAYRLAGAAAAPVVVALGGISGGRDVFPVRTGEPGWWDEIVGPGRPLDTDRFRVLGMDFLGGSHRSTGPAAGQEFPSISAYDQAECLLALLRHLRIDRLRGCVGASYGGMVALALAEKHPDRLEHAVVISAAHRTHPMSTAWRSVQRNFVRGATAGSCSRWSPTSCRVARATPPTIDPRPSSASPNPSTCTGSSPRGSRCRSRWSVWSRTSSCRSPTCARCGTVS
jgi:homoserine O-acetyltransferase